MCAPPKNRLLLLAMFLALAGCPRADRSGEVLPQVPQAPPADDAGEEAEQTASVVGPRGPPDPCAAFNARKEGELSDEEHLRRYGCPKCPCACIDGEIRCAPCEVCVPPPQRSARQAADEDSDGEKSE